MNILLKDFQEEAVADLVKKLRRAARDARDGELQAVSLASPTGSGKTVMLIEAIERLLQGDEDSTANPDATFLWITDQPYLNLQTRDKMRAFSTVLTPATLQVLENDFDAEVFPAGRVYFLNTQKLGKNNLLVNPGDKRTFTLWETIANTARERPGSFFVLIDEAHRGMAQSKQALNEANSIIQKFIVGSDNELPPIPLIVGISATLQRFNNLLNATQGSANSRTVRSVTIDAANVRASGLIKDAIQFGHPAEKQPSDMTLLRAAVRSWLDYRKHWTDYSAAQGEPFINPLLAVQVADASSANAVSQTDLAQVLSGIEAESGPLPEAAFAHAFQGGAELTIGGRRVRHIAPSEIHADPDAQIVFFKTSLTTGWDCPRAEVMMSFRTAQDATYIAQLVGRMVRTPFARRVDADEHLNTVALYLPHYDEKGLKEVVAKLTDPDSPLIGPTEVRTEPVLTLGRTPGSDALFAALSHLPSYSVPRSTTPNEVRRLMKLSRRLSTDGLYPDAPDRAKALLTDVIDAAHRRCCDTDAYKAIVNENDVLDLRLVSYLFGEDFAADSKTHQIPVSPENIDDLFETAGRKVGEGLHKEWWRKRVDAVEAATGKPEARRAKLELVALADADLKRDLQAAAKKQAQTWLTIYQEQIRALSESKRQAYQEIQGLASEPELSPLVYPDVIEAKVNQTLWPKHLYADDLGQFPADLNNWETPVLKEELKRGDLAGWLRVVPRKPWALTIPYRTSGTNAKIKPVYIDFLIVRKKDDSLIVDIIDPHLPTLGDAADKLAGLAHYAEQHSQAFGRIESIILDGDDIRRLNLQDAGTRERAKRVRTSADVQQLFDEAAVSPPTG